MNRGRAFTTWLMLIAGSLISSNAQGRADDKQVPMAANDPQFHAALLSVAKGYSRYVKIQSGLNWAPELCAPPPQKPISMYWSEADGANAAHGEKVYCLFAKDPKSYLGITRKNPADGVAKDFPDDQNALQVIVKESWKPAPVSNRAGGDVVHRDGKTFTAGERADLFIMMKFTKDRPGTDEGWIYGTVSPDGKTVTSSGRVQQCMNCHSTAPHDRLFGLNYDAKTKKE